MTAVASIVLVAVGLSVDIPPAGGVKLVDAQLCSEDGTCAPVRLPVSLSADPRADHVRARLVIDVPTTPRVGPQALYFPDYADAMGVTIGGRALAVLEDGAPSVISRNRPALFTLPEGGLEADPLQIEVDLAAHPQLGARLGVVWFGPQASLTAAYEARYWMTVGLAQAILLVLCGLSVAFIWLASVRRETMQIALAVAIVSATTFSAFFAIAEPPLPVALWTLIWDSAIRIHGLAAVVFLFRLIDVRAPRFEIAYGTFTAISIAALALAPAHRFEAVSQLTHTVSVIPAVMFVVIFWSNRHRLSALNTRALMALFAVMIATGISQLFIDESSAFGTLISQLMPLLMLALGAWMMMGQLVSAIRQYEALTQTLHAQVAAKSAELEATYAELAERRR
ncbi:MAG: hypothetical protein AAF968_14570, partial [Pseudomonadota bacterium]